MESEKIEKIEAYLLANLRRFDSKMNGLSNSEYCQMYIGLFKAINEYKVLTDADSYTKVV